MNTRITTRQDILKYAAKTFKTTPEYLWKRTPNFAVLRRSDNNKWYGLIMDLPRHTMGLDGNGTVDVMNVKCDNALIGMLMGGPGYRHAYHMNKSNWITVILDGSVARDEILALIKQSYNLAGGNAKQK